MDNWKEKRKKQRKKYMWISFTSFQCIKKHKNFGKYVNVASKTGFLSD